MAIDLTLEQLTAALRLGTSQAETDEATRLLAYVYAAVQRETPDAPAVISNEAAIRLAAYLYDQPTTSQGDQVANALRFSGAKAILLPYRSHRAGNVNDDDSADPSTPISTTTQVAVGWSFDRIPLAAELTVKTTGRMLTIPVARPPTCSCGRPTVPACWGASWSSDSSASKAPFSRMCKRWSSMALWGRYERPSTSLGSAYENSVLTVTFL